METYETYVKPIVNRVSESIETHYHEVNLKEDNPNILLKGLKVYLQPDEVKHLAKLKPQGYIPPNTTDLIAEFTEDSMEAFLAMSGFEQYMHPMDKKDFNFKVDTLAIEGYTVPPEMLKNPLKVYFESDYEPVVVVAGVDQIKNIGDRKEFKLSGYKYQKMCEILNVVPIIHYNEEAHTYYINALYRGYKNRKA